MQDQRNSEDDNAKKQSGSLLSAGQVAERLNVTPQTIYRWANDGILPAICLGPRTKRFEEADIEKFIKQGKIRR